MEQERPKSRINITLEIDQQGASQKHELPMKCLLLGNYSPEASRQSVKQRTRYRLTKNNIDQAFALLKPTLTINTNAQFTEKLQLSFNSMKDFDAENIALQMKSCRKLIAMRQCLKDLKSIMTDSAHYKNMVHQYSMDSALAQQPKV